MFSNNTEDLLNLGAEITTREIKQQPELWQEVLKDYQANVSKIEDFLAKLANQHDHVRVIFTGAGTSAYVGQAIYAYLNQVYQHQGFTFEAIATTDIVSHPYTYLMAEQPTLLVSFARSGNSPESVATVQLAKQLIKDLYQMTITCAPEGKLALAAQDDVDNLLLLQPSRSNDAGFAMTGSYTCMMLSCLLVFDKADLASKITAVEQIVQMGQDVLQREDEIQAYVDLDFDRLVYLGSAGLFGLAHEAQLKILELTAGKVATQYESPLGFRHGPKSFVNDKTIVIDFVSNQAYSRQYDVDLLNEVASDQIAKLTLAVTNRKRQEIEAAQFSLNQKTDQLDDVYLAFPYIIFGQAFALMTAVKVGNTPDTPSPSGTVNRVVKGVSIHPYQG
ncbi:SIS domain-containing protein [Vaginisenegalia massiliensis]|uniref:SIS domain-containing protein n=1 Tax=Vaginisenegalia massiliensis TaxID=2058294 RepID=UPI000F5240ED|nr:SIS domain-containing protein [Vaginisenegalia massiliensis]